MNANRDLDRFLRQKLSGRSFEYEEAYWEEAAQLIELQQALNRRRRRWYISLNLIALLGILSAGAWLLGGPEAAAEGGSGSVITSGQAAAPPSSPAPPASLEQQHLPPQEALSLHQQAASGQAPASTYASRPATGGAATRGRTDLQTTTTDAFQPPKKESGAELMTTALSFASEAATPVAGLPLQPEQAGNKLEGGPTVSLAGSSSLQQIDAPFSLLAVNPMPPKDIRRVQLVRRPNHWSLVGGVQLSLNSRSQLYGDPLLGVSYSRSLSPWLSMHADFLYHSQSGLAFSQHRNNVSYAFGFERDSLSLVAKRLHYLELPLYVRARLGRGHYVLAGMSYAYLLQVSGELHTHHSSSLSAEAVQSSQQVWVSRQAFRPHLLSLRLGYERQLWRGGFVGAVARYRLGPIYGSEASAQLPPLQLQLYLRHRLFKH